MLDNYICMRTISFTRYIFKLLKKKEFKIFGSLDRGIKIIVFREITIAYD